MGRCDAREACYPSAACRSVLSISALLHSSSHRCPHVFLCSLSSLSLSVDEDSHTSLTEIFFFFFHLCVLCSPLIYCWTCLQNGPGAFHSVKRGKGKRAPVSEKSTSRNRENSSSVCACLRIILVMLCLGCVERSSDCSFDMIHI